MDQLPSRRRCAWKPECHICGKGVYRQCPKLTHPPSSPFIRRGIADRDLTLYGNVIAFPNLQPVVRELTRALIRELGDQRDYFRRLCLNVG